MLARCHSVQAKRKAEGIRVERPGRSASRFSSPSLAESEGFAVTLGVWPFCGVFASAKESGIKAKMVDLSVFGPKPFAGGEVS